VVDTKGDSLVRDPSSIDWDDVDTDDLRYRVRQRSGESNELGLVKFMFPNRFSIYLHDTPARELFDRPLRTLSHGCVRVEDPVQLAEFVLDGQEGWGEEEIRAAMQDSRVARGRTVPLERPVPVYLLYLTAFVRDGELHFRNDPYGKDHPALARLGQPLLEEPQICEELGRLLEG
jgi:L,D-transpeptidase YcbB